MDRPGGVTVRSNRWIKATASCEAYHLIPPATDDMYDKFYYQKGPNEPILELGPALWDAISTYYLAQFTPGDDFHPEIFQNCGVNTPRCAHLYVAQLVPEGNITDPVDFNQSMIYICNSTVANVQNALLPEHKLGDGVAFSIGSSLAYSGMWTLNPPDYLTGLAYSLYPVR